MSDEAPAPGLLRSQPPLDRHGQVGDSGELVVLTPADRADRMCLAHSVPVRL